MVDDVSFFVETSARTELSKILRSHPLASFNYPLFLHFVVFDKKRAMTHEMALSVILNRSRPGKQFFPHTPLRFTNFERPRTIYSFLERIVNNATTTLMSSPDVTNFSNEPTFNSSFVQTVVEYDPHII